MALGLLMAQAAFAQLYINNNAQYYFEPGPPQFPQINATAFDNENVFSVTYNTFTLNLVERCEPWWGTLFYTNNSEMILNAPFANLINGNGPGDFNTETPGAFFEFDVQQTNSNVTNSMAGTFYNPGVIHVDSVLDGNNVLTEGGSEFFLQTSVGNAYVLATNIIIPGDIEVGVNGILDLTGQNLDLSHGFFNFEQGAVSSNNVNATLLSEGEGTDTNGDWNPFFDLKANSALGSLPDFLSLTNSLSYFGLAGGPSNFVSRSVFLQNNNTNVPYTVYIAPALYGNEGALVQWTGTYIDSATGETVTNYLYLFHFYINSTNLGPIVEFGTQATAQNDAGFFNFVWSQTSPLAGLSAPTAAGFQNIFNDAPLTNIYEFFNAQLVGTTISTNVSVTNPSGALTNYPNRIDITATHALNLASTQITGENYISLIATNEFDGSAGALINSPYYDINLGNTNGVMTISNLVAQFIPAWGGLMDEWSARWTNTDVNNINTDYRVMLLESALTPTISPQVQNLTLNATNSVVISDVLNVMTSLYATPASLTITTNGFGVGAASPEGELNLENANSTTWSWGGSFPNLLWLTNNGGIVIPNSSSFIGNSNIVTVTTNIPAIGAANTLSELGTSNVTGESSVSIAAPFEQPYLFTNRITTASPANYVLIGANINATMTNLIAAINRGAGAGTVYSTSTATNPFVTAGTLVNHAFTVTATTPGPSGDNIAVSTTSTNLTWNGGASTFLAGGANAVPASTNVTPSAVPYNTFITDGLLMDRGATIWANNFLGSGVISNGTGSFTLNAETATLTNCSLTAGGAISMTANTLLASNIFLQAGQSLTLNVTNWLTDGGVTNGNIWLVDSTNGVGFNGQGLELPFLPANNTPGLNNLLGTTIDLQSPGPNKEVFNTWAGQNYGESTLGYLTNNVAVGQLILDAVGQQSSFNFSGTGANNAIYVDRLILEDFAALTNNLGNTKIVQLNFNPNLTIYYADALSSGQDVSYIINGFNNNHLVWVPQYVGFFSSTNLVYPNGSTNIINAGVAADPVLDSNGNGIPNEFDPEPLFVQSQLNFSQNGDAIMWDSIPSATNIVQNSPNMLVWSVYTNFVSPSAVPPVGGWPIPYNLVVPTNGTVFYRVIVSPNNADLFGE